jgi:hypothetical protein
MENSHILFPVNKFLIILILTIVDFVLLPLCHFIVCSLLLYVRREIQ